MARHYTAPSLEAPDRLFQITQVTRTHTQLWLQSDGSESVGRYRLEVLFQCVQYVSMPFVLRGLSLRQATPQEWARLSELHQLEPDPAWSLYMLSRSHDWFIVSATPVWAEADLSYRDKSVFWGFPKDDDRLISTATLEQDSRPLGTAARFVSGSDDIMTARVP
ncbi:hypothetical protein [Micromonospora auratinigra]|uniref:Uncharacterized protein n=1 Tax=Micromonospora auratinigra TaxID=261654 RepID=A0A1A9A136_9ACTN|nr:hypothetical protein [Micromonospora auratinigra]SBT49797.1 hypothetical protein GA0070611_4551 [Micromonospora auratinigra]